MRAAIVGVVLAVCVIACTDSSSDVETRSASDHDPTSSTAPATDPTDPTDPTTPGGPPITAPPPDDTNPSSPSTTEAPIDPNASGVGDAYFPDLGNPGLDVQRYDIALDVGDDGGAIDGDVTLTITATEPLTAFTLDAVGLDVETVTVDDEAAEFAVESPELRIEPANPIPDGSTFVVRVGYAAAAQSGRFDPGSSTGWFRTETGSFVLNEPDGARTWLPSNDHPSDKAAYSFVLTVDDDVTGVANGSLQSHEVIGDRAVWRWDQPEPMATYLIQVLTGPFELVEGEGPNGLPLLHAVFADDVERMQPYFDVTEDMLEFFAPLFGPYPLDSYGLAMTDGRIGGALEEQGRSLFSREDFPGELDYVQQFLLSHELAHQWFGNAVTLARWRDIWLNEAFATYAEWLWLDHIEMVPLDAQAQIGLLTHQDSDVATGNPGVADLFASEVYDGGATVLHALRLTIGDDDFFELLQRWVADNDGESRTTDDFIALAEDISGTDLSGFVADWLDSGDLPDEYP